MGHAAGQLRRHAPGLLPRRRRQVQRHHVLVRPVGLEEPDHHAEPFDHLRDVLQQPEGRPGGVRHPGHQQGLALRRPAGCLDRAADQRRHPRRGQGQGRQVPAAAAGLQGRGAGRLRAGAELHEQRLRVAAGDHQVGREGRPGRWRRLPQGHQGLSAGRCRRAQGRTLRGHCRQGV
ncbi:hypothetical protein D3C81_1341240 [compost metagenome]